MHSLTHDHICCGAEPKGFGRRIFSGLKWLLPTAVFVLIPKCPLCIVAYVAAFTGLGLSISTASQIRTAAIILCLALLLYCVLQAVSRILNKLFHVP